MGSERPIDTGDHVHHGPTGEDWVVAYVDGDRLCPCGWPPGEARLSDCTRVYECSSEERTDLLRRLTRSEGKRGQMARAALAAATEEVPDGE